MMQLDSVQAKLEAQLAELQKRQQHIAADLSEPLPPIHQSKLWKWRMIPVSNGQSVLVAEEIASVKRALSRIAQGTYGKCVRCGADIAQALLAARPEAALCIQCAQSG